MSPRANSRRSTGLLLACALAGMGCPPPVQQEFTFGATGPGTVSSEPLANGECLSATPGEGFAGSFSWSPGCDCQNETTTNCTGANQCAVPTQISSFCFANFCSVSTLRVVEGAGGSVSIEDEGGEFSRQIRVIGSVSTGEFCNGQDGLEVARVSLTAVPDTQRGWLFDRWEGHCTGDDPMVELTLNTSLNCTARFRQPELALTVTGSGKVVILPDTAGCRATLCTATAPANSYVTLVATADPFQQFLGWGGEGCSGKTDSPIQVAMDDDKICEATFSSVAVGSGSGVVEIVSLADDESLGNDSATDNLHTTRLHTLAASADLSVVGFASRASNLLTGASVPAEVGSTFARTRSPDPSLATTQQISPPPPSIDSGTYTRVSLSADGRYAADVHTSGTPSLRTRVYRRNLSTDVWEQISTAYPAEVYDDRGREPKISGNGRYVVYRGLMIAFPANPALGFTDGLIVRDTCTGAPPAEACTPRSVGVSRRNHLNPYYLLLNPFWSDISSDGRYVLFNGSIPGMGGTNAIYLHDRDSDEDAIYDEAGEISTAAVVSSSDATQWPFFLDASGRYVVFHSVDASLPDNADAPYGGRAFRRDTCPTWASTPCMPDQPLSVDKYGLPLGLGYFSFEAARVTDVSAAGRYVAFATDNHLMFADEEPAEQLPVSVVRDTCLGAVLPCTPENRPVSLRTDGQLISNVWPEDARISDDGSLAAFYGPRNALIPLPSGHLTEVLLSVTGFPPDEGLIPNITGRDPSTVPAGSSQGFLLTVFGEHILPGAQVTLNNDARRTIFISNRKLQVWLEGDDLDQSSAFQLRIVNPGGRTSTPKLFEVGVEVGG